MKIKVDYLGNHLEAMDVISDWYENEWGYLREYSGAPPYKLGLPEYCNCDKVPLMMVAICNGQYVGVAQLKLREMDIYPQYEHWLGGVFVDENFRSRHVATTIVSRIILEAKELKVPKLYLQTEQLDGGLYRKLGWSPIERVEYQGREVLVMDKVIS